MSDIDVEVKEERATAAVGRSFELECGEFTSIPLLAGRRYRNSTAF